MKKLLPTLGLTASLATGSAAAMAVNDGSELSLNASPSGITKEFSPASANIIREISRDIMQRQRLAGDFHEAFAKAPTFGKAGGGGFVKFKQQMMIRRHKRSDIQYSFDQFKPV